MRIHTDATEAEIRAAVLRSRATATVLTVYRSQTHARAFDVHLEGESRRRPNGGSKGLGGSGYAATWDQWGVMLGALYRYDPGARVGNSRKHPIYADDAHFHARTAGRFHEGRWPEDAHGDHKWQPWRPYVQHCRDCSAVNDWSIDQDPADVALAEQQWSRACRAANEAEADAAYGEEYWRGQSASDASRNPAPIS